MRLMLACSMLLSCVAGLASYPRGPLFNVEQTWSGPEIVLPQRRRNLSPNARRMTTAPEVASGTGRTTPATPAR